MRLFVAYWPNDETRRAFSHLQERLRSRLDCLGGRPIPLQNLHLTLAFLGEQPDALAPRLARALAERPWEKAALEIDTLDYFASARTWWAGPQRVPEAVAHTRKAVLAILRDMQIETNATEPFRAHVSLARGLRRPLTHESIPAISWNVEEPRLVASVRGKAGGAYALVEATKYL
ncbi:MAG: RNA 2',3'-cyclic phosphodiesterase [Burkholderiaceae bacterium]|jgi:2'-5' RNA ligase